jgi:hypothetical protein
MTVSGSPGIGTITLGSAILPFLTFDQAGVSSGDQVVYAIQDSVNSEIGIGTYTAVGTTLSRDTVLRSTGTSNNTKITVSNNATVYITTAAEFFTGANPGITGLATLTTPVITTGGNIQTNAVFLTGSTGSGTGGNVRYYSDDGIQRWLAGITGVAGDKNFHIYDMVNATDRLTIDYSSGDLNTTGSAVFGSSSGTHKLVVNGANSGASGGSYVAIQNNGSGFFWFGNKSAVLGTAYDATPYIYANATIHVGVALALENTLSVTGTGSIGGALTVGEGSGSTYITINSPAGRISAHNDSLANDGIILNAKGTSAVYVNYDSGTGGFYVFDGSVAHNPLFYVTTSGLYTTGTAYIVGTTSTFSSALTTRGAQRNQIEFGHPNSGYGSTIGYENGSGSPYIAFFASAGTNSSTYKTWGISGLVIKATGSAAGLIGIVPDANADNQSLTSLLSFGSALTPFSTLRVDGSNSGWYGIQYGPVASYIMCDSAGNGGFFNSTYGWGVYISVGQVAIGSSSNAGYTLQVNGTMRSTGNATVSGTLFTVSITASGGITTAGQIAAYNSSTLTQFTDAAVSTRGKHNGLEWGHANQAGYGSTIGYQEGGGTPYICFYGGAGTTGNLFKTLGFRASIFMADGSGGFTFGNVASANADNQTYSAKVGIANTGTLFPSFDNTSALGGPSNRWSNVYAVNGTIVTSDERLKPDFAPIENPLHIAMQIDVGTYGLRDSRVENNTIIIGDIMYRTIGVKAQQIRKIMPKETGIVRGNEETEMLGLVESKIGVLALAGLQELNTKVDSEIEKLTKEVIMLKAELSTLKERLV